MHYSLKNSFLIIFLCAVISACSPRIDQRGRFLDQKQISHILPKIHNKQDVQRILGSPSTISTFGESVWIYTGVETETTSFFSPSINEFHQIQIFFDDNGFVQQIESFPKRQTPENISLTPIAEKTPVRGHKQGFFQQMFGNFGRISRGGPHE